MTEDFHSSKPIYSQIADKINKQIIRKELKAGEKLPSVRDMAISSGVNPNTVQRTYSELERLGIVETRRGQGTFVTEDEKILNRLRDDLKGQIIRTFIEDMKEMGFTSEEMIAGLKDFIQSASSKGEKDE